MNIKNPYIMIMKAGPYCGYSLDEIINIKQKEEARCGKFFWGYSGVFCRPNVVQNFVNQALNNGKEPNLLFVETKSSFSSKVVDRFSKYSTDKSKWQKLPDEVLLVGNKQKPHFAIVGSKLEKVDVKINLSDYCVLRGMLPDKDNRLDSYFRYRVDKVCAVHCSSKEIEKIVTISYSCVLTKPYSVYIR